MQRIARIVLIISLGFVPSEVITPQETAGVTYYVDAMGGADGNDGLSIGAPWKTVAKVNRSAFSPGDTILFKREGKWREKLVVPSSGTAGNYITFGAYGIGADPIFDGSIIKANADFSAWVPTVVTERLRDGGFEVWDSATKPRYWHKVELGTSAVNKETVDVHGGSFSLKLTVDPSNSLAAAVCSLHMKKNTAVTLTLWYKTAAGKTARIKLADSGNNACLKSDGTWGIPGTAINLPTASVWTQFRINFTSHSLYRDYTLMVSRLSSASSSILFADVSVVAIEPSDNVYKAAWTMGAGLEPMIWENEMRLVDALFRNSVYRTPGSFYYDSVNHYLYVHASDSSHIAMNGKAYEIPSETENIDDDENEYISFNHLIGRKTYSDDSTLGGILLTGRHNQVLSCVSHGHRRHCLSFYIGSDSCLADGCLFYDSAVTSPVTFYQSGIVGHTLKNSDIYNGKSRIIILHNNVQNSIIERCTIHGDSAHSAAWAVESFDNVSGTMIRYNYIYGHAKGLLLATNDENLSMYCNIIDSSHFFKPTRTLNYFAAIHLDACANSVFYNNVFYNGIGHALKQENNSTGTIFKNNIVYGDNYISVESGSETDSE